MFKTVRYITEDDRVLEFSEFKDRVYTNVNMDDEGAFDVSINGSDGIAKADKGSVSITWGMGNTYFSLFFKGNLDEAERIAESVQRIYGYDIVND